MADLGIGGGSEGEGPAAGECSRMDGLLSVCCDLARVGLGEVEGTTLG
jgi:hypothetical protein